MRRNVSEIYEYIDSFAPFESAEEWDNVGVLVGSSDAVFEKALLALDITNDVLWEAVRAGADLVISHHPIIFGGLKSLPVESPVYRAAALGVTCLCAHTNLDKSPVFGVNTALAAAVGLENCRVSEKNEILFIAETGAGVKPRELAEAIKKRLHMDAVAFTECGGMINKVGICSGAGGSEIYSAAAEGCDAFITGEIKHHELLFANEHGISTYILGHYRSEDVVISPLCSRLAEKFPDVTFIKSEKFTDGVVWG